ncbi:MAG: GntR family transcriptional regulator [Spongiibacteraceae bacterium]
MRISTANSNLSDTVSRLRERVLACAEGEFLGSEEVLERELGVSKPTIRQAARVLEREGMLRVKRGNNGGYFSARPDAGFIEETVASYLEVLRARPEDLTRVATALWIETVRQAASLPKPPNAELLPPLKRAIARLPEASQFSDVSALDQKIRRVIFDIADAPYVELIFNINANFARRRFAESPAAVDDSHGEFVEAWRHATILMLDAIFTGDTEVAVLAANRARNAFHRRLWPNT